MSESEEDLMDSQDYAYDSDESDEGYGDDGGFESVLVRQRTQAEWQVLDSTRCLSLAEAEVGAISELLCCPTDLAALLLRYFKWDREKLTNDYMADAQAVLQSVGVLGEGVADRKLICLPCGERVAVGESTATVDSLPPIVCQICFESTRRYSALSCGHRFCNACYTTYVGHQIADEGHACVWATCPAEGCKMTLTKELVLSLPLPEETLALYENATRVERSYVDDNPLMRWCRAAGCTKAIQAPKGQLGVTCTCGERFCFSCGEADHRPCSCENLAQWIVKCRDDSETFNWLVSHTKACPKCHTAIEKNGGCNHMTCKKGSCKHEFCWVCLGPWKDHSGSYYSCNKYDASKETAEGGTKKDSSRAALERYLHYYTRYTNHHNSLKLEEKAVTVMEAKIKAMEQLDDNTWMDCQFLAEANDSLRRCRYALQYTYVYAFYLPEHDNFRHNFEMQQTELELQTEELSGLLEKEVGEIVRQDIVHCFQMALKRLSNLFELVDCSGPEAAGGGGLQRDSAKRAGSGGDSGSSGSSDVV